MKKTFTSICAKALALSIFFCAPMMATAQVIFTQNFNASTVFGDYVNAADANKFDFIGSVGTSAQVGWTAASTTPNKLRTYRFAGTTGFARTTAFVSAATATVLKVKFNLNVFSHTANTVGTNPAAANFYIGSGFVANSLAEAAPHSRFLVGYIGGSGANPASFYIRDGTTNSGSYSGEQAITWYINNSSLPINYLDPTGNYKSLDSDKADIWVATTRIFNGVAAIDGTKNLTNFKFNVSNSGGTIIIDDIEISRDATVLSASLTDFKANKVGATNQLAWTTESETDNKGYDVERQTANGTWETLGFVKGTGKAATYTFEDKGPLSISYYRLRQIDFDGKETLSKVVSVSQDSKGRLSITPNPTSDKVTINLNQNDGSNSKATMTLFDIAGRQVLTQTTTTEATQLDLSNLAKGMYLLTVQSNNALYQEKIVRQ